ncbi:MAG: serine hydrolase domain-containing protein [Solirubrobacteraceae bacterium]
MQSIGTVGDVGRVDGGGGSTALEGLAQSLDRYGPRALEASGTPGLNLAVALDGEVWERGYGFADVRREIPMTPSVTARVGSISKLYTAIAALRLVEMGRLTLDEPVSDVLGDVVEIRNPRGEREVTVMDLLTHRSGLALDTIEAVSGVPEPLPRAVRRILREDRRREYHRDVSRWTARVGERFQYSSLGMALLGLVIERRTPRGESVGAFIASSVFEPLGLESTMFPTLGTSTHTAADRLSVGYARFGRLCVPSPSLTSSLYTSVGLITTPGDHVRVLDSLLRGEASGTPLLSAGTVEAMIAPRAYPPPKPAAGIWPGSPTALGLGVELTVDGGAVRSFGHLGAYPWGWWGAGVAFPGSSLAVAAFCNAWDMTRWHNPLEQSAPGLVLEYIRASVPPPADGPRRGMVAGDDSWDAKQSYAAGLLLTERVRGLLGLEGRIHDGDLDRMASGSFYMPVRPAMLDAEAFKRGAMELNDATLTPEELRSRFRARSSIVETRDLPLLSLEFGRRGHFPIALPAFADS